MDREHALGAGSGRVEEVPACPHCLIQPLKAHCVDETGRRHRMCSWWWCGADTGCKGYGLPGVAWVLPVAVT